MKHTTHLLGQAKMWNKGHIVRQVWSRTAGAVLETNIASGPEFFFTSLLTFTLEPNIFWHADNLINDKACALLPETWRIYFKEDQRGADGALRLSKNRKFSFSQVTKSWLTECTVGGRSFMSNFRCPPPDAWWDPLTHQDTFPHSLDDLAAPLL